MRQRYRINRLAKKEEAATVKRIFALSAISALLALFMFTWGIPLLGKFADFLELISGSQKQSQSQNGQIITAPNLDPIPAATNSALIDIKGFVSDGNGVELYLNNNPVSKVEITSGNFSFEDIKLQDGENTIGAKTLSDTGQESEFSKILTIKLDTESPSLEVENPQEKQSFSGNNRIKVSGKTDQDSQVYANGFLANINFEGQFEILIPVAEGDSQVEIRAIDEAGNVTTEKRNIHFSK
ncbi:MAG: hypothetical protein UT92_C0020G0006 [Candidatus Curtissbacteria bacterium GW2011_GWA1_40_24]|uniref:Bacillopeptidase F n=1 Tax=Candidatus Curtissbacteria bacterium GW2011_GWA1_40_24 TaxID=1618406 RepID=A0A0G0U4K3_9BACT|nr:MAG: hypothetical protein UT92_C0020G0006 [Candidatus Curtissbacteria bacterium GW2011_GWA1_40_24]